MNYRIDGNGKTLVFIHGLSDNLLYWEFLANNLQHDHQILRVDLRGHGDSELYDSHLAAEQKGCNRRRIRKLLPGKVL